jgi:hypothetical protein
MLQNGPDDIGVRPGALKRDAMTRSVPPQRGQTEISISKTRFSRCAQVRGAVSGSGSALDCSESGLDSYGFESVDDLHFLRARFGDPGTMNFLNGELGAKTPWYRVRLALGLGTKAASLARKSVGVNRMWVVPSRKGCLSS